MEGEQIKLRGLVHEFMQPVIDNDFNLYIVLSTYHIVQPPIVTTMVDSEINTWDAQRELND